MPENTDLQYRQAVGVENVDSAQGNWPNIETGQATVATAGTAVQLNGGTSISVPDGSHLVIRALPRNTDTAYVGDSTVTASSGHGLASGDPPLELPVGDVASVYVDVAVGGEGVSWVVATE